MLLQGLNIFLNFLGRLLDLQGAQALHHGLQISEKRGWRNNNHVFFLKSVFNQILGVDLDRPDLVNQEVVVNAFGRNEHEGEFHGIFIGLDVFGGLVNPVLQIDLELLFQSNPLRLIGFPVFWA